ERKDVSLKVITDHVRAIAFLIADGVIPSNEGRGYVLRRLMRRSIRHTWLLGEEKPLLEKFLKQVIKLMSKPYPELETDKDYILRIAKTEEERFSQTLKQGVEIINDQVKQLKKSKQKIISGDIAFKLHDTYGFPVELTAEIAAENKLSIDVTKFEKLMNEQKARARAAWKEEEKEFAPIYNKVLEKTNASEFVGYKEFRADAKIVGLIVDQQITKEAKAKQKVEIILDKTPFYAEKGGQATDTGKIFNSKGIAEVSEVREGLGELVIHKAVIKKGSLKVGQKVSAQIDEKRRRALMRAHTATHILHWALRSLLGTHVKQAGSLVESDRLRFDFTHFEALTKEQITSIEDMVNEKILASYPVRAYTTTLEYAREIQAMAFFGEKYSDFVRVVESGDFSKELCGGTHVSNTSFVNLFWIKREGSVGSSVRRIEAVTGALLFDRLRDDEKSFDGISKTLGVPRSDVLLKIAKNTEEYDDVKKILAKKTKDSVKEEIEKLASEAKSLNGLSVVTRMIEGAQVSVLRDYSDLLRQKLGNSVVMLGSDAGGGALLLASASKEAESKGFNANKWLKKVQPLINGSGGGNAHLAQAGGKNPEKINKALEKALDYASKWAKKASEK
ncbi:MAG: alanine--tRNA ligase, partial [Actinobacteria bacterium]